jgi:iron complex transport system substrate-binding protein
MRCHVLWMLLVVLPSLLARAAEITDATGRSVYIPDHPARILPAGPPAAVLLGALAPDLMVGWPYSLSREARAWLPDVINNLPKVPMLTGRQDVTQEVTSLHPDLIIDYGNVSPRYIELDENAHTKTGIPTVLLDGALTKTPQTFRELGVALHREERGRVLAFEAEAILSAVPPSHGAPLRVVYGLGLDGLDVAAADAGAAEVFNLLGWQVLGPEGTDAIRRTSIEVIASLNPDVLIFQSPGMRQVVAQSSQWRALRAVREHRAYVMPDQPFGWLGGPPSINRLLAVAAAPKNEQMNALREGLQPLSP